MTEYRNACHFWDNFKTCATCLNGATDSLKCTRLQWVLQLTGINKLVCMHASLKVVGRKLYVPLFLIKKCLFLALKKFAIYWVRFIFNAVFLIQLLTVGFWRIQTMVVWTLVLGQRLDQLQHTNALLPLQLMERSHDCARQMVPGLGRIQCVQVSTEVQTM